MPKRVSIQTPAKRQATMEREASIVERTPDAQAGKGGGETGGGDGGGRISSLEEQLEIMADKLDKLEDPNRLRESWAVAPPTLAQRMSPCDYMWTMITLLVLCAAPGTRPPRACACSFSLAP